MRLPLSWLKDYVDFEDSVEGLADKLTFSGVEVEGIETIGLQVEGVVVGDVRAVRPHPDADRLTVCTVWNGEEEMAVVCGAPNVVEGMKGAFAPVGTVLANGMTLKKAKIRGVASQGMLCAEDELGLSDQHEGIIGIEGDVAAGTPLRDVLGPPETVFELEITPNRPDCLSIIGIAREVAALYGATLKLPAVEFEETATPASELTRIDVEDASGCPRYTGRVISNVVVRPSPSWMQRRLTHAGIRPINNLVDITNYVLLECGHPMHAFDYELLEKHRIVVRRATDGERITTLDEAEHELNADTLIIADGERPVAVAGIMGGVGSEIRDETKTVLLESAYFDPPLIRATSGRLQLSSESSYRFERGTDIENVAWASRRGAALMTELAEGQVAAGVLDVYPAPAVDRDVSCRWERVRRLVGVDADNDRIRRTLTSLGLDIITEDETAFTARIPTFRHDLQREVDLIEEFARLYGLDKIPTPAPVGQLVPGADERHSRALEACRERLVGLGLHEAVHYSLVPGPLLDLFALDSPEERVVLPNPVSMDQSVLRTSMIPQMVETLGRNHARQCARMASFELGRVFRSRAGAAPVEEERLCVGLMGPVGRLGLEQHRPTTSAEAFAWAKGVWEAFADAQRLHGWSADAIECPCLEAGHAVALLHGGEQAGLMGLVSPELTKEWRIAEPVAVVEVSLTRILADPQDARQLKPLTPYPSISRDMALVVPDGLTHGEIMKTVMHAAPAELEDVTLFDIFYGQSVGPGKKSMAYSLRYRSPTRTLTDGEANEYHDHVKEALKAKLKVEIRES